MLLFEVNGQKLTRKDSFAPATDSVEYLKAQFSFKSSDWNGKAKTALFRLGENTPVEMVIDGNGTCKVPAEVLIRPDNRSARINGSRFYITVIGTYGTTRITTDEIEVKLNASGYDEAVAPADPTESQYEQILTAYADAQAACEEATAECKDNRNLLANAVKNKLTGEIVTADDVSPVEHSLSACVRGKNLFNPAIMSGSYESNGITITRNGDKITLNGTTKAAFSCPVISLLQPITKGKEYTCTVYRISGTGGNFVVSFGEGMALGVRMKYYDCTSISGAVSNYRTFTAAHDYLTSFMMYFNSGTTFENLVFTIQLEQSGATTDYEEWLDPSTVTVKRYGKNLIPTHNHSQNGYKVTKNSDGSVSVTGASDTAGAIYLNLAPLGTYPVTMKKGIRYKLSWYSSNGRMIHLKMANSSGEYERHTADNFDTLHGTDFMTIVQFYVQIGANNATDPNAVGNTSLCGTYRFQLEAAETATDFEAYKEPTEYTPEADGTVLGMTSLSPNMTILTDTEGAIVECEYTQDTFKAMKAYVDEAIVNGEW